ncbi:hypothetical protein HG531_004324 [Fusarium graminearum]|nr:hypothetical protein HG531_004324 [Fusarium graminearum]
MALATKTIAVDPDGVGAVLVRVGSKLQGLRAAESASNDELDAPRLFTNGSEEFNVTVELSWSSSCHYTSEANVDELRDDVAPVSALGEMIECTVEDTSIRLGCVDELGRLGSVENNSLLQGLS